MAGAEDGLASVISTELNLDPLSPDPAHTDTITSCHQPCSLNEDREIKKVFLEYKYKERKKYFESLQCRGCFKQSGTAGILSRMINS